MTTLITSDLHFNENERDAYRWDLFLWLKNRVKQFQVQEILILGDLTDAKDHHSAKLVNRLVEEMTQLASRYLNVTILKGNHDFADANHPFFGFLSKIQGLRLIAEPYAGLVERKQALFLPATRNYEKDWAEWIRMFPAYDAIFAHQTFAGAKAENGQELDGIPTSVFRKFEGQVWSGDIHVPQTIGKINYVGSPYHVRFGDRFVPRVVLMKEDLSTEDLFFPTIRKRVFDVHDLGQLDRMVKKRLKPGDHVKVRFGLRRADLPTWPATRASILERLKEVDCQLFGVSPRLIQDEANPEVEMEAKIVRPSDQVRSFSRTNDLSPWLMKVGINLLRRSRE